MRGRARAADGDREEPVRRRGGAGRSGAAGGPYPDRISLAEEGKAGATQNLPERAATAPARRRAGRGGAGRGAERSGAERGQCGEGRWRLRACAGRGRGSNGGVALRLGVWKSSSSGSVACVGDVDLKGS